VIAIHGVNGEGGLSSFTPYAAAPGIPGLNKRW
jgi:hypothetical protein